MFNPSPTLLKQIRIFRDEKIYEKLAIKYLPDKKIFYSQPFMTVAKSF